MQRGSCRGLLTRLGQRQHDYRRKCFTRHALTYLYGEPIPRSTPQRREAATTFWGKVARRLVPTPCEPGGSPPPPRRQPRRHAKPHAAHDTSSSTDCEPAQSSPRGIGGGHIAAAARPGPIAESRGAGARPEFPWPHRRSDRGTRRPGTALFDWDAGDGDGRPRRNPPATVAMASRTADASTRLSIGSFRTAGLIVDIVPPFGSKDYEATMLAR